MFLLTCFYFDDTSTVRCGTHSSPVISVVHLSARAPQLCGCSYTPFTRKKNFSPSRARVLSQQERVVFLKQHTTTRSCWRHCRLVFNEWAPHHFVHTKGLAPDQVYRTLPKNTLHNSLAGSAHFTMLAGHTQTSMSMTSTLLLPPTWSLTHL